MKKKILLLIGIILVIIFIAGYSYVQYQYSVLKKLTYNYLYAQGYNEQDILLINPKIKKLSLYTAEVTFSDEPKISYDYKMENGEIRQLGLTDKSSYINYQKSFKHLEREVDTY